MLVESNWLYPVMTDHETIRLCPAQQRAFDSLSAGLAVGTILRLQGGLGRGKTTVLRRLHHQTGGAFINARDFVEATEKNHPLALEETAHRMLIDALKSQPVVYVDDLHLIDLYSAGCHFYPRTGYFNTAMMALCTYALEANKKFVFSTRQNLVEAAEQRSYSFAIARFTVDDYASLIKTFRGGDDNGQLDFEKVFRFAPKLNAHQLKAACDWLAKRRDFGTELFIEYLRSQRLASNVDLGEVQDVDLAELKGVDDVLRSLEINIILPLENDGLTERFKLRSKRGVVLHGPPGTGKTTIGRALAHRLKGKFFLIDGTFIAGTDQFYQRINQVFEAAKDNAPAVIFIDDADAIFEDGEERGLYRYLLTMIDGLESESAGRVCVMMTAMNVAHLPPALVRSGRVELWLEMKMPNEAARTQILSNCLAVLPDELRTVDMPRLVAATDGFTGADLRRMVEDGKAIYAYDHAKAQRIESPTEYFIRGAETVQENKRHYAAAEAQAALRPKAAPGNMLWAMQATARAAAQSDDS